MRGPESSNHSELLLKSPAAKVGAYVVQVESNDSLLENEDHTLNMSPQRQREKARLKLLKEGGGRRVEKDEADSDDSRFFNQEQTLNFAPYRLVEVNKNRKVKDELSPTTSALVKSDDSRLVEQDQTSLKRQKEKEKPKEVELSATGGTVKSVTNDSLLVNQEQALNLSRRQKDKARVDMLKKVGGRKVEKDTMSITGGAAADREDNVEE